MQNLYRREIVFIFRKITQDMLVVADIEIQNLTDNMSEEEFFAFCQANRELRIERDQNGNVIIMPPTGSETGRFNTELITELNLWNRQTALGVVFDSSTGFKLPNGAVRSPDASWIRKERWDPLAPANRKKFAPLCPDFVVELRSETDNLEKLREKMTEYIENGCRLAWLIDRSLEEVHIYQPQKDILHVHGFDQALSGEDILPGVSFDLTLMR
jgi:Uma2 family endonuclease